MVFFTEYITPPHDTSSKQTPEDGDIVVAHIVGYGKDRNLKEEFWNTRQTNEPFRWKVEKGRVIRCLDEAIRQMQVAER